MLKSEFLWVELEECMSMGTNTLWLYVKNTVTVNDDDNNDDTVDDDDMAVKSF